MSPSKHTRTGISHARTKVLRMPCTVSHLSARYWMPSYRSSGFPVRVVLWMILVQRKRKLHRVPQMEWLTSWNNEL